MFDKFSWATKPLVAFMLEEGQFSERPKSDCSLVGLNSILLSIKPLNCYYSLISWDFFEYAEMNSSSKPKSFDALQKNL